MDPVECDDEEVELQLSNDVFNHMSFVSGRKQSGLSYPSSTWSDTFGCVVQCRYRFMDWINPKIG